MNDFQMVPCYLPCCAYPYVQGRVVPACGTKLLRDKEEALNIARNFAEDRRGSRAVVELYEAKDPDDWFSTSYLGREFPDGAPEGWES